jgi:acyl-CoA synthetase (AMP-forming)/AMP-acid ligase II
VRYNDAIARGTAATLKKPVIKPDDVAVLQYTGGTTGVSKGAVLLHRNLVANVLQNEIWAMPLMSKIPKGEQPTSVCALPLYHIFAFTYCMMLSMRMGGKLILIPNPRDLPAMFKELSKHRIHLMPAVNTLFNGMANHPDFNTVDWSHLIGRHRRRHGRAEFGRQAVAREDRLPDPGRLRAQRDITHGQRQPGQCDRIQRLDRCAAAQHLDEAAR